MSKELQKEKIITIIPDKQIVIDKSDLDFLYKQISDLEAKLAESETKVKVGEFWYSAYQGKQLYYDKVYAELRQSYDEEEQLKQQLAEKDEQYVQSLIKLEKEYDEQLEKQAKIHYRHLKDKEQRIAELEEQLVNSIRPKFKIGQEVYKVYTKIQRYPFKVKIIGFKITKTRGEDNIYYDTEEDGFEMGWYTDEILFTTKEEAEEKLKELKGE